MEQLMTPAAVARHLRAAALDLDPGEIVVQRRAGCFAAMLPGARIAWFPATDRGREHLTIERRVLRLIAERCSFAVPRVLYTDPDGWDLRALVPGDVDPQSYAARLKADPALQLRLSVYLAEALAEQHTCVHQADVAGWLSREVPWPLSRDTVKAKLPMVTEDALLIGRITSAMDAYYGLTIAEHDRVLVHGDLGFHNMAFDPSSHRANGIFDYGDAAWADRHYDFRYLVFGAIQDTLLDATMRTYTMVTGVELSRHRVLLYNAASAIGHLADRAGFDPAQVVSGRTLEQDLAWTRWALSRGGF